MDPEFAAMYDACARQWDELRKDLKILVPPGVIRRKKKKKGGKAKKEKGGGGGGGEGMEIDGMDLEGEEEDDDDDSDVPPTPEEKAKSLIWLIFYATHQRFFRSLYVAAKVPTVIKLAREAIEQGYAPVIGLQTTGESQIKTRASAAADRRRRGRRGGWRRWRRRGRGGWRS